MINQRKKLIFKITTHVMFLVRESSLLNCLEIFKESCFLDLIINNGVYYNSLTALYSCSLPSICMMHVHDSQNHHSVMLCCEMQMGAYFLNTSLSGMGEY